MKSVIFMRGRKFLNNRYSWGDLPDLFPSWHAPVVLRVMMDERNREKPTGIAVVDGSQVIDLDNLEVIPL